MDPKQVIKPVERCRDSEGRLEMVDGLLGLALGPIYVAEEVMTFTDPKLID